MIHIIQCLCGPARHAIMGVLYDDKDMSPEDVRIGFMTLIEEAIKEGQMNRRCEICDKWVPQFWYEDGITKEQDMAKARDQVEASEKEQMVAQIATKALRKAGKN